MITLNEFCENRLKKLNAYLLKSIPWTSDCTIKIYKVRWLFVKLNFTGLEVISKTEAQTWLSL